MDFKRIEWIFFLAFLGVNIFLFTIHNEARNEQNNVTQSNQTIPIEQRLKTEDIKYSGKLSDEHLNGYYLSGEQTEFHEVVESLEDSQKKIVSSSSIKGPQLTHTSIEGFYLSDDEQTEETVKEYLQKKDQVLFGDDYQYLEKLSELNTEKPDIVATQSYEGIVFNDSSSRIDIFLEKSNELWQIVRYTQTHVSDITPLRERMSLYSEKEAVNTLYLNNKIPSHATIVWTQLAYTMILKVQDKNVYIPAWFVAIKSEGDDKNIQVERVNAFSNRIITNNAIQTVENP